MTSLHVEIRESPPNTTAPIGASLAVNIDVEVVVGLWGKGANEARTLPWTEKIDLVLGSRLKAAVGYGLRWPEMLPVVPEVRVCFGSGAGSSLVLDLPGSLHKSVGAVNLGCAVLLHNDSVRSELCPVVALADPN
jgi:hypothetical protein